MSIELLGLAGLSADSRVIDIGGGASTLVDDLLDLGARDICVLDVSDDALAIARNRIGDRAKAVNWYATDVLHAVLPAGGYDLCHDRAVFHFLTDPTEVARYAQLAAEAVKIGGHAVIGGFAPDGPKRCSGLPVTRRSAEDLAGIFASRFSLLRKREERHRTPAGTEQSFEYALMLRLAESHAPRPYCRASHSPGRPSADRAAGDPLEETSAGQAFSTDPDTRKPDGVDPQNH